MTAPKVFQLPCPNCGCGISSVKDTRPRDGLIYRRRKCVECGHKYTTYECIGEHPAADTRMLERLRDDLRAALAMVSTIIDQEGVSS